MLDHWAHLGGAAFGALYYAYGPQLWDWMRATNGGVVGKATTLSNTVSRDRLEMAVQVVLSEDLPKTNEERLTWYNHERWLEAGGQVCLQGNFPTSLVVEQSLTRNRPCFSTGGGDVHTAMHALSW